MVAINRQSDGYGKRHYKDSKVMDGNVPVGTFGHKYYIEFAELGGRLRLILGNGYNEKEVYLYGNATGLFMRNMQVQKTDGLLGKTVSVFLNGDDLDTLSTGD